MKAKHAKIRVQQCLALAEASNCPRRKFGALLIDPDRNVILMDGYNGGPRGGGELCGGDDCLRDTMGIESGTRIHTTEYDWPKSAMPSGFAMKVRRRSARMRLLSVRAAV